MNDIPRIKLQQILLQYGPTICGEPNRVKSLLLDLCKGEHRAEINVLILALTQDVLHDLFPPVKNSPPEILIPLLVKRLQNEMSLTDGAAWWAIESWALALGVIKTPLAYPSPAGALPVAIPPAQGRVFPITGVPLIADPNNPVLVVSRLGLGQYKTIGDAIKSARPNSRIIVRPGVYQEDVVLDKPVEIVGEGAREKIVFMGLVQSAYFDQSKSIQVLISGITFSRSEPLERPLFLMEASELFVRDCELDGKFITSYETYDKGELVTIWCEAGVLVRDASVWFYQTRFKDFGKRDEWPPAVQVDVGGRAELVECEFVSNCVGITVGDEAPAGQVLLRKCVFNNCREAIRVFGGSDHLIEDCTITDAMTGMLFSDQANGQMKGCSISGCEKAGLAIEKDSNPAILRCSIRDNKNSGCVINDYGDGVFQDCQILNNITGILVVRGNPRLQQCRISGNSTGIVFTANSAGNVEGCDLRGNSRKALDIATGAQVQQANNQY